MCPAVWRNHNSKHPQIQVMTWGCQCLRSHRINKEEREQRVTRIRSLGSVVHASLPNDQKDVQRLTTECTFHPAMVMLSQPSLGPWLAPNRWMNASHSFNSGIRVLTISPTVLPFQTWSWLPWLQSSHLCGTKLTPQASFSRTGLQLPSSHPCPKLTPALRNSPTNLLLKWAWSPRLHPGINLSRQ